MKLLALGAAFRLLSDIRERHRRPDDPVGVPTPDGRRYPILDVFFTLLLATDCWPRGSFREYLAWKRAKEGDPFAPPPASSWFVRVG